MSRKARVDRSPEEKWQIVQEGIKSGNVSETCRRHIRGRTVHGSRVRGHGGSLTISVFAGFLVFLGG
jgi:hypothetical protein